MTPADEQTPIAVTVTPVFADYLQLNFRFVFRNPVILFAGLFPLALGLCYPFMPGIEVRPDNAAYLLFALVAPTLFFVVLPLSIYRAAKKRWRTVSELREPRTYTFSDAGIQATGETFNTFVAWSHIVTARRMGEQVVLGTGQRAFYLIPVQAFESDEAWQRFCELVEAKVTGARLS